MRIREEEDGDDPEVNVAPLLDCIFLLLIFFLLTSTIQQTDDKKKVEQLALDLPESAAAREVQPQGKPLIIQVDSRGRYYVNNERVGIEKLHGLLRQAADEHPRIRIEGDRNASFDSVAHVVDLCEFEGLNEIAIRTRNE